MYLNYNAYFTIFNALYEIIAFLVVLSIMSILFKILLKLTNIFEGLLKVTIVFAPISKIGGAIVGGIEAYIWAFLILYIFFVFFLQKPHLLKAFHTITYFEQNKILLHNILLIYNCHIHY